METGRTSRIGILLLTVAACVPLTPLAGSAQDGGPVRVFVQQFGANAGENMAKEFTADLTVLIGQVAGYVVVTPADLLTALPRLGTEDRFAQGGCLLGRQLAMLDLIDVVVCGGITTHRTEGFQVEVMISSMAEREWQESAMESIQTPSLDRAVMLAATQFEEWDAAR